MHLKKTLLEWVLITARLHSDKRLSLWFQGEARFGMQGTITRIWALKGQRPSAWQQREFEWTVSVRQCRTVNGPSAWLPTS